MLLSTFARSNLSGGGSPLGLLLGLTYAGSQQLATIIGSYGQSIGSSDVIDNLGLTLADNNSSTVIVEVLSADGTPFDTFTQLAESSVTAVSGAVDGLIEVVSQSSDSWVSISGGSTPQTDGSPIGLLFLLTFDDLQPDPEIEESFGTSTGQIFNVEQFVFTWQSRSASVEQSFDNFTQASQSDTSRRAKRHDFIFGLKSED